MNLQEFATALLSGAYALFCAHTGGTQCTLLSSTPMGTSHTILLACRKDTTLTRTFDLHEWQHEQKHCAIDARHMHVLDTVVWKSADCKAHRAYVVSAAANGALCRTIVAPWHVEYRAGNRLTNAIVSQAVRKELVQADTAAFEAFANST